MGTKNDKVILSLKKEIENKKKLLAKSEKVNYVTNCNFEFNGTRLNLHVATKEELLRTIALVKSMNVAIKEILPNEKLVFGGFTADEWLTDMIERFNYLNISSERSRLKALETKLHNLLSIDTKIEIEIEDLKSQI